LLDPPGQRSEVDIGAPTPRPRCITGFGGKLHGMVLIIVPEYLLYA
jgi:hypothetical protein